METVEKLELSYMSLKDEYKEIFLDIACILKGQTKEDSIRILESCGFHARNGLKVLEQRSLITVDEDGRLDMHQRIEEMGKNIVRREHPDEPNKHSRLWIQEEIEDILANDMGTEATRCLKLTESNRNARIVMKGLGKMKKLRYLEVTFACYNAECLDDDDTSQYFSNSLRYLKCTNYPFLYLPKTFQANNLVGLEMESIRRMAQLWEEEEEKVLDKLRFLSLSGSNLTTFDFEITPNLETLSLINSFNLKELCMPVRRCQKLKHLNSISMPVRTLSLSGCALLEKLPEDLCRLIWLEHLDIRDTGISHLDSVCTLRLLRSLIVYSDLLEKLPWDLGRLEYLEKLCVRSKKIEYLPDSICMIKCLRQLDVTNCSCLRKLPEEIGLLESLEELYLSSTKIKHIPDSICMLQRLRQLDVTNCSCLGELPEEIGRLKSLEELYLSSTKIKHIPDSICMLQHLEHLYLDDCALLEKLPEDIGQLECLEKLDITDTGTSHLPQSIFGLKGLLIAASSKVLQLYDFPSEIKTTTSPIRLEMSSSPSSNNTDEMIEQQMSSSASSMTWKSLVGMESRVKDVGSSLESGIVEMSSAALSNNTDEMIEQQMSTSSSSIQKSFKYDVFISFRGEDTVNTVVDHLYKALDDKGICTYKDDEKIQKGERISDDLIKAIEDSKFYIIVFSKNYASSSWCLEELDKILECHKMPGHTAYPLFFDVEPTEVRNQSGKWKGALKEAADLAGWELKNALDGDQDKFIKKIVDKMSLELHFGFDANSVGMVTLVKDVVTPATVLNKLVEAIGSVTAFLGQLWANYYPRVVEVDLTPGSAFSFIIWCLLVFAGLKSQSVTGFPFKTHPNAIKVPFTSLLIYAFASMAELVVSVARLDHTSVYAIIARLGRISSLCLFVTSLAILLYI